MAGLLGLAILFLVIAFFAYIFGAWGIVGLSLTIAKILLIVFIVLFVLALLFGGILYL